MAEVKGRARQLIEDGTPANTIRARAGALRYFWQWAGLALDLDESYPVPADVVLRFATDHLSRLAEDLDAQLVSRGVKAKLGTHMHSKTDQTGEGLAVPVAGRAAAVLRRWMERAEITSGPIFRRVSKGGKVGSQAISGRTVARVVQKRAERAGYDPAGFGGHSLRAGFVTSAGQAGVALPEVMAMSGHKTANGRRPLPSRRLRSPQPSRAAGGLTS